MSRLMMLDSGAFSVWAQSTKEKKVSIDLESYIEFCEAHPDTSYFVNLDVIPGKPNNKSSLTKEAIQESCKQGWKNYKRMIERLPKEKVIPVYHQNDNIKWLDKYLSFGVPYIGISPANDSSTKEKIRWMKNLRKSLFDGAGRPLVKTHGFAVTSFRLMKLKDWEWYSVDSASWKLAGAWGSVYLPQVESGCFMFDRQPHIVPVSAISVDTKRPKTEQQSQLIEFLKICKIPLGTFEIVKVEKGYKIDREAEEIWHNKKPRKGKTGFTNNLDRSILRPVEKGVLTAVESRLCVNAEFMRRCNIALHDHVKHIYFAGALMPYPLEFQLEKRLLSYHHLAGKSAISRYEKHLKLISKGL